MSNFLWIPKGSSLNILHVTKTTIIWGTVPEIQSQTEFFVMLSHFLSFDPLNNPKNQNLEKIKKKTLEILSFYTCAPQMTIIWCMVPQTLSATDRIFCHFGLFFCPFTLLAAQKIKMSKKKKKNEKNTWRYHHFKHVCQNLWLDDAQFLRYGARQMDRQTNGRTEKMTQAMSCNWTHNIFHEL